MRSTPPQFSFSAGELSPLLLGRPDYERQRNGCRAMRGFLPLRQGGMTRAPGTHFRGETRGGLEARLIPFEFAENDSARLEFTEGRMRVWRYGNLVFSGPSPFELVTGLTLAQAKAMQWEQSADVTYLATGTKPIQALKRLALDSWTIGDATFRRGPFRPENADEALTITPSAEFGSVTLTASAAVFVAGHVGGLFLFRTDNSDVPVWVGNQAYDNGDRVENNGRIYQSQSANGTDSGVNPPSHASGSVLSGPTNIKWLYIADQTGIVRIDGVASGTSATATVLKRIPPGVQANGTWRWAEGAWSAKNGWPRALAIHDQRLFAASTPTDPRTVWASALGDFADMEPTDLPDGAFAYEIASGRSRNAVVWLQSTDNGLSVGTLGEEHASASTARGEAIGVENAAFFAQSYIGSRAIRPIAPRGAPILVSRDARRVYELRFDLGRDKRVPVELSLPAEHLGAEGFTDIAWQASPIPMAWLTRGDGTLALMVTDPDEEVLGWAPLTVAGGFVESLCVTTGEGGTADVVTAVIRRTVNGATKRFVEDFADIAGLLDGATALRLGVHLFAVVRHLSLPASAVAIGLDHLEGEQVYAWSDQGGAGPLTVAGGQVTLPFPAIDAWIGLFDATHEAETTDLQPYAPEGATLGRQKAVKGYALRLHRTAALEARAVTRRAGKVETTPPWRDLVAAARRTPDPEGVSGVVSGPQSSGHAPEVSLAFRPVGGAPATVLGLVPVIDQTDG